MTDGAIAVVRPGLNTFIFSRTSCAFAFQSQIIAAIAIPAHIPSNPHFTPQKSSVSTSSDKMLDTAKIAVISVSAAIVGVILLSIGVSVLSKALEKRKERKRQTQDAVVIPEESAEDQRLRRRLEEEDAEAEADRAYFGWTAAVR
jgi:hypothetical protein